MLNQIEFSFWYICHSYLPISLCLQIFCQLNLSLIKNVRFRPGCLISSWSYFITVGTGILGKTSCFTSWSFELTFLYTIPSSTHNLSNILSNGLLGNWSLLGFSHDWTLFIQGLISSSPCWSWIQCNFILTHIHL